MINMGKTTCKILTVLFILFFMFTNQVFCGTNQDTEPSFSMTPESTTDDASEGYPEIENLETRESPTSFFPTKKDPFLAGFYAFLMMGAGHFYTGKYQTGSLLLFSDLLLKSVFVGYLLHLKSEYTSDSQDTIQWRMLNATDKALLIGFSVLYAVALVFNITDAVKSANEYNRRYMRQPSLRVSIGASRRSLSFCLSKQF